MSIWHLIIEEIRLRRLSFALGVLSVLLAVGVVVAQVTLLDAHDVRTREILEAKRAETEAEMARMEDDYRKIMKKLGFNLLILPEGQNLVDFHTQGYAAQDMPEDYVRLLAESGIMTVRHLLPSLERKIRWPEQGQRPIILVGTRGEVPLAHRKPKEPMLLAVATDEIVLGHEIWDSLGLATGDTLTLLGREFVVTECYAERGNKDDVTAWIDLATAQELLDMPGRINAILALKCHCASSVIAEVRETIAGILPGCRVYELKNKVVVRAEARERARVTALAAIEAEKRHREALRAERQALIAWLGPLVALAAALWIGLLALANVRERTTEIGILRALGLRSRQIMTLFLARAVLIGLVGAVAGFAVGFFLGLQHGDLAVEATAAAALFHPPLLIAVVLAAPLFAALASWPPALLATSQDPARVLREE